MTSIKLEAVEREFRVPCRFTVLSLTGHYFVAVLV
jgi:hypothetical protein